MQYILTREEYEALTKTNKEKLTEVQMLEAVILKESERLKIFKRMKRETRLVPNPEHPEYLSIKAEHDSILIMIGRSEQSLSKLQAALEAVKKTIDS